MTNGEQLLSVVEGARMAELPVGEFRIRLVAAEVVRVAGFEFRLRATDLVAVQRAASVQDRGPSPRRAAEAAREDLRRAAAAGDPRARRALRDIGDPAPAPRHWSERDDDRDTG